MSSQASTDFENEQVIRSGKLTKAPLEEKMHKRSMWHTHQCELKQNRGGEFVLEYHKKDQKSTSNLSKFHILSLKQEKYAKDSR